MILTKRQWIWVGLAAIITIALAIYLFRRFYMGNISKYFDIEDFDSPALASDTGEKYIKNGRQYLKDSGKKNMSLKFIRMLNDARENYGKKFIITSGYRTPQYNATLSGAVPNSAHTLGCAVDVSAPTTAEKEAIVKAAIKAGFRRIGWGPTFIHLDNDATKPQDVLFGYSGSQPPYNFQTAKQKANAA